MNAALMLVLVINSKEVRRYYKQEINLLECPLWRNIRNIIMSMPKIIIIVFLFSYFSSSHATEYQSTEEFLFRAFSGKPPKPKLLWLTKDLKKTAAEILNHNPGFMRTRYWKTAKQSVWIINEIGKTKPITVAVIIKDKKIMLLKVLAFRESRGWEVKHDFFTSQFKQNTLASDLTLNQPIDGISGATLSVRALTKVAKLALFFDGKTY